MRLSLPYDLAFVNVVATFLEEIGICHGADTAERQRLRLIGEEAFAFIMAGIPGQDFSELFQLQCMAMEDRLAVSFSNHGRPMNVREVKSFSLDDMDGTADGLSLQLLRGLCDELAFENRGRNGWELAIQFRIKQFRSPLSVAVRENAGAKPVASSDFTVRISEPDDIPGIINLVYNTYRYSYAKAFAYSKEQFLEAMDSGRIFSMIVATADRRIIGHQAVIFESPGLGEIGMVMVDPAYRRSRAFLILLRDAKAAWHQRYPEVIFFVKAVTSHKSSQAFMGDFSISLLELSVYNHAAFVGMDAGHNPRESLVHGFNTYADTRPVDPIHVPAEHLAMVSSFFANTAFVIQVESNRGHAQEGTTLLEVKANPANQQARLVLESVGADVETILKKHTRALQQDGIITIHAILPTHADQPADLDRIMVSHGYFFSGIKPNAAGRWDLVYTHLLHQKFDFDKIQLFSTKAVELCHYIHAQYGRTQ